MRALVGAGKDQHHRQAPVAISPQWAFLVALGMLWLMDRVTPVKVTEAIEEAGLDEELFGEHAYTVEA